MGGVVVKGIGKVEEVMWWWRSKRLCCRLKRRSYVVEMEA